MPPEKSPASPDAASRLFRFPGFLPLYLCQFLGALNDNIFKSALLVVIAFRFSSNPGEAAQLNNLAAALLILPFLLVSPLAGQLADRNEKSRMIFFNKIAELAICLLGALALAWGSIQAMLLVLLALGTQSAMFGPNKYATLPQLLPRHMLVKGNAQIASATFVAILLGTMLGGVLARAETLWLWVGGGTLFTALLGVAAAARIPRLEVAAPDLQLNLNFAQQTWQALRQSRSNPMTWQAMLGIAWFWFLGSAYLTQLPALARFSLGGDELLVPQLIFVFILGIAGGAFFCARLSKSLPEIGLVPIALILVSLVSLHLGLGASSENPPLFASGLDIHLLGWAGGMFGVPLYSALQHSTQLYNRARIIALSNIINALFMVLSALLGILVLGLGQFSLGSFFILLALLNGLVAVWFLVKFLRPMLRLFAQALARACYRIRTSGLEHIPASGPALLVSNHVSYADAILLMAVIERPVRFIMTRDIYDKPWLNWILRAAGCIPVGSPLLDRSGFNKTFRDAIDTLRRGELLFIFPEGRLTPDGRLLPFKRGLERILQEEKAPVVPLAIDGMWGSFFSHGEGPVFRTRPRLRRREVAIRAGSARYEDQDLTAAALQQRVGELLAPA